MEKEVIVASVNQDTGEITEVSEPLEPKTEETGKPAAEAEPKPGEGEKPADKPGEAAAPAADEKPAEGPADEETATDEVAKEKAAEAEAAPKPKEKTDREKRIHKLNADNQWLKNRVAELTGKGGETTQPAEAPTDQEDKQPKDVDFETLEQFTEALGRWSARQEYKELQAADAQWVQDEEARETIDAYNQRVEKAREAHEDFEEVVGQNVEIPISVQMAIIELDNGPEVAYHLGKNPELTKKLMGLSPLKAVAEIGRVSAILAGTAQETGKSPALRTPDLETGKSPVPGKIVSSAPAPIKPVGAGATRTAAALDDEDVNFTEFTRRRDTGEV